MREDKIYTMKLAFSGDTLKMVTADLKFDGNHLAVNITVPNGRAKQLFEDEIYDFLYRFKKNKFVISSLNIHTETAIQIAKETKTPVKSVKEKWLRVINPESLSGHLDVFA